MKETLLILPILVVRIVLLTGLLLAGAVASRGHVFALEHLVSLVFLPGLLLGVISTYLRATTTRVIPIMMVPATVLVLTTFLVAGVVVGLPEASEPLPGPGPMEWNSAVLHGRTTSLFVDRHTGVEISDSVLVRHGRLPRLRHHPLVYWNYEDEMLVVPGEETISTSEISGLQRDRAPSALILLIDDLRTVLQLLPREIGWATLSSPEDIMTLIVLAAVLALAWPLVGLTRWPLLNGVITLGWARLLPAAPRLWQRGAHLIPDSLSALPGWLSAILAWAPAAVWFWLVLTVPLIVLWIIQPSLSRRRQELGEAEESP